jgi:hypothetical protein
VACHCGGVATCNLHRFFPSLIRDSAPLMGLQQSAVCAPLCPLWLSFCIKLIEFLTKLERPPSGGLFHQPETSYDGIACPDGCGAAEAVAAAASFKMRW